MMRSIEISIKKLVSILYCIALALLMHVIGRLQMQDAGTHFSIISDSLVQ